MADGLARVSNYTRELRNAVSSERIEISTRNRARFKGRTSYYVLKYAHRKYTLNFSFYEFVTREVSGFSNRKFRDEGEMIERHVKR